MLSPDSQIPELTETLKSQMFVMVPIMNVSRSMIYNRRFCILVEVVTTPLCHSPYLLG
jgi:hypothetical protein